MHRRYRGLALASGLTALAVALVALTPQLGAAQSLYQIVNATSDPGHAAVDVYINGGLVADDLAVTNATDFQGTAPGAQTIEMRDAATGTTVLASTATNFTNGVNYAIVLTGVETPANFDANPDGNDISFAVEVFEGLKTAADNPSTAEMLAFHGAPDAGTVDLVARNPGDAPGQGTVIFAGLEYGQFLPYQVLAPGGAILDLRLSADPRVVVGSFEADFSLVVGGAVIGFAQGFTNPATNQNGDELRLVGVVGTGQGVAARFELDKVSSFQLMNNSPDPANAVVDIYMDDVLLLDDFAFCQASAVEVAFVGARNIQVAPSTSASSAEAFSTFVFNSSFGEQYFLSLNGYNNPGSFDPNPDGRSTALELSVNPGWRAFSLNPAGADLAGLHCVPDLGTVDLIVRTTGIGVGVPLITGLAYGDYVPYFPVSPGGAVLDIVETGTSNALYSYEADFGLVVGTAVQGILNGSVQAGTANAADRPRLKGALYNGFVFVLDRVSATSNPGIPGRTLVEQNYPNPFNPATTIPVQLDRKQHVSLRVFDLQGRLADVVFEGVLGEGRHELPYMAGDLSSGTYLYRLVTADGAVSKTMVLTK